MKTLEEILKLIPESIEFEAELLNKTKYEQHKNGYKSKKEFWEDYDKYDCEQSGYLAITTNSARYKCHDNCGFWTDAVCFKGDPTEAANKLYEWLLKNKLIEN